MWKDQARAARGGGREALEEGAKSLNMALVKHNNSYNSKTIETELAKRVLQNYGLATEIVFLLKIRIISKIK